MHNLNLAYSSDFSSISPSLWPWATVYSLCFEQPVWLSRLFFSTWNGLAPILTWLYSLFYQDLCWNIAFIKRPVLTNQSIYPHLSTIEYSFQSTLFFLKTLPTVLNYMTYPHTLFFIKKMLHVSKDFILFMFVLFRIYNSIQLKFLSFLFWLSYWARLCPACCGHRDDNQIFFT